MILNLFKLIFLTKWVYLPPKKKDLLIYDGVSAEHLYPILGKKSFDIFYNRYESINISVLLHTIYNNGFFNLKKNYKINYFKRVNPKIIITLIDENPGFFKLKHIYPKAKYISIQIALKGDAFFDYIDNFKKKNKHFIFESDFSFVSGKNDLKKYSKFISSKIISLGSIKNNNNPINNRNYKKINEIIFISQFSNSKLYTNPKKWRDYKIFNYLKNYCKRRKLKLKLLARFEKNTSNKENFYRKIYGKGNWEFLANFEKNTAYKIINKSQFIVFETSTLGFEGLTKNIKGVCFPSKFPYKNYIKKYKKSGIFWSEKLSQKILNNKIDQIIKMKNNLWKNKVNTTIKDILDYNPKNIILKSVINKIN